MRITTPRTYNSMDIITFGKHKGLTIDRVAHVDPNYIRWMRKAGICDDKTIIRFERNEFKNDNLRQGSATVWTWD